MRHMKLIIIGATNTIFFLFAANSYMQHAINSVKMMRPWSVDSRAGISPTKYHGSSTMSFRAWAFKVPHINQMLGEYQTSVRNNQHAIPIRDRPKFCTVFTILSPGEFRWMSGLNKNA